MKCCLLVLTACLLTTSQLAADEAAEKAQILINRAVKAIGGEKALNKVKIMSMRDEGTYYGMGDGVPYKGVFHAVWPDKMRFEVVDTFTLIQNGDKGWMNTQGMTIEFTEEQMAESKLQRHCQYVTTLIPLAKPSKKYKLSLFGRETIDGEPCAGVNVNAEGQRQVTLFFSRKTGLLRGSTYVVKAEEQGNKEVVEKVVYKDYKEIDGVMVNGKGSLTRDGKSLSSRRCWNSSSWRRPTTHCSTNRNSALLSAGLLRVVVLVVRGSPDPALSPTEGLQSV